MNKAPGVLWRGLAVLSGVVLCASGGGAGPPVATTQPASAPSTRPEEGEAAAVETAIDRMERAAETLRLLNRVNDLEQTVSELTRQVGGPTRNLTIRPGADVSSLLDRIQRDQQHLETKIDRLQREVDAMSRRMDRLERQR